MSTKNLVISKLLMIEFDQKSNGCLRIGQNKQALRFFAFIAVIWGAYVEKMAS